MVQASALAACAPPGPEDVRVVAYIEPGGAVGSVGLVSEGPLDPDGGICLVEQIRAWKLPDDSRHVIRTSFPLVSMASAAPPPVPPQSPSRRVGSKRIRR
jgi:hypothetical protein